MHFWSKIEQRCVIWGMQFILKLYLFFGRKLLQIFLYPVFSIAWLVSDKGRLASLQYLQKVSRYHQSGGINANLFTSYRHFISYADALIDKLAVWSGSLNRNDIEYSGREAIINTIGQGQGVFILSSHLGNLAICRVIAKLNTGVTINLLVHTQYAENINTLLTRHAEAENLNLIQISEVNASTAIHLQDKIEAGEVIVIAADRISGNREDNGAKADFFGCSAIFPQQPFILALLLKCPVYTLFCLKQKSKQVIYFDRFSDGLSFTKKQGTAAIEQCVQEYALLLQQHCLKEPLQWFNLYDFWLTESSSKKNSVF